MNYFDSCIESLQKFVSILSVQSAPTGTKPFGDEVNKALQFALDLSSKLGLRSVNIDNMVGYSEFGNKGDLLGILGHVDVVPVGSDWSHKHGEISNGILYGRGVMDDKGAMLLCLYALKQLIDEGHAFNKRVRFIWGANEESGWACIDRYVKTEEIPNIAFSPDADFPVINCEKGVAHIKITKKIKSDNVISIHGGERVNMVPDRCVAFLKVLTDEIKSACNNKKIAIESENGIYKLTAFGKSAHGSRAYCGDNAIVKMLYAISSSDSDLYNIAVSFADVFGGNANIKLCDEMSGELTVNLGLISYINDILEFELDIRYPISYTKEYVLELLKKQFVDYELEITAYHLPLYIEPDNKLVTTLLASYNKVCGVKATPISIGGATYARAMPLCVSFGPVLPDHEAHIHEANESASLADLKTAYNIYYEAIKNLTN